MVSLRMVCLQARTLKSERVEFSLPFFQSSHPSLRLPVAVWPFHRHSACSNCPRHPSRAASEAHWQTHRAVRQMAASPTRFLASAQWAAVGDLAKDAVKIGSDLTNIWNGYSSCMHKIVSIWAFSTFLGILGPPAASSSASVSFRSRLSASGLAISFRKMYRSCSSACLAGASSFEKRIPGRSSFRPNR